MQEGGRGAKAAEAAREPEGGEPELNLAAVERRTILQALRAAQGNRTTAAALLGIDRRTLQRKMAAEPAVYASFFEE